MTAYQSLFQRLPLVHGRSPDAGRTSLERWTAKQAMRRSWVMTALFLLTFVAFWEVREMLRVQPVDVSPAEVMQLAASGTLATATVQNDHILLQRRSAPDGSLGARAKAWAGLPTDGQLLVMRAHTAADLDRVRAQLAAHGVRVLEK